MTFERRLPDEPDAGFAVLSRGGLSGAFGVNVPSNQT